MTKNSMPSLSSYKTPQELADDRNLTDEDKREMLIRWKNDLDSRLVAESEGMSNENPLKQSKEGSLADRLKAVNKLLEEFGGDDDLSTANKI